jgi:hypothetical protein
MMKGKIKERIMIIMASVILLGADQVKFDIAAAETTENTVIEFTLS